MIPIYEQGSGRGIGHSLETFERRFVQICESKKDQSFAFIFYDFSNQCLRQLLKDQGVFTQLDRLSGESLSIFFLHTDNMRKDSVSGFNTTFTKLIGVKDARPPCVVFFRWSEKGFIDISIVPLENADLVHGFHELYEIIKEYKAHKDITIKNLKYLRWIPGAVKFVSLEAVKHALSHIFNHFLF
jgi:hypothetical protein